MCQYCLHYSVEDAATCAPNTLSAEFDSVSLVEDVIVARRAGSGDAVYQIAELRLATKEEDDAMLAELFGESPDDDH